MFALVSMYKFFPDKLDFDAFTTTKDEIINSTTSPNVTFIYVDLSGAVSKPGVYKLPPFSRVGDLISEGGGFKKNASVLWISRNLNLSKFLTDSQKVYVPYEWETYGDCTCAINSLYLEVPLIENYSSNNDVVNAGGETSKESSTPKKETSSSPNSSATSDNSVEGALSSKVNVNTASQDTLDALNGIGPAYALKIISNRPYKDLTELVSKSGVPESTLTKLSSNLIY